LPSTIIRPSRSPHPMVLAGAQSQIVRRTTIAVAGPTLPILNPVRVAEEFAMLDTMSRGRLVAGMMRGTPNEYVTYNINPAESPALRRGSTSGPRRGPSAGSAANTSTARSRSGRGRCSSRTRPFTCPAPAPSPGGSRRATISAVEMSPYALVNCRLGSPSYHCVKEPIAAPAIQVFIGETEALPVVVIVRQR
jgi:hypothetical protein